MVKRKLLFFCLLSTVLCLLAVAGCQVYMAPDYQAKVQASCNALDDLVRACPDPNAAPEDYCAALAQASRTLHLILDESYGR